MKLFSLVKKAVNLTVLKYSAKNKFIYPNLYLFNLNKTQLKSVKKILFFFDSDEYMHLGDHLFFLPLIQSFINSGFDVYVAPTKIMSPLFKILKFKVLNEDINFKDFDLIVSRIEMVNIVNKHKALLVNVSKNLSLPICDQLIHDFSKLFLLNNNYNVDFLSLKDDSILNKFHLDSSKKIILFSLKMNTASYLNNNKKLSKLVGLLNKYGKDSSYQIVQVGGADESINPNLNFPYVDLGGKTSVLDIFNLVNNEHVFCYIGFDAFVMHVFSLLKKPSFVVFRGRISKRQSKMLKKFHVNLFEQDNYVTLLN